MINRSINELSDQELLQKIKEIKNGKIINGLIIGFTIGVFCYSIVKNGFGLFAFFPLIIAYLLIKNSAKEKRIEREVQKEITTRNLK